MATRLRPMVEADLDRVMELEELVFPTPWRRSFFHLGAAHPQTLCLVAEDELEVVGYAVAWLEGDEFHIANIAVAPDRRRCGVGSALMAAVEARAAECGALTLYLEVRESNAGAQSFYRGRGFIPTGTRRGYYPNGEDAVIMEQEA